MVPSTTAKGARFFSKVDGDVKNKSKNRRDSRIKWWCSKLLYDVICSDCSLSSITNPLENIRVSFHWLSLVLEHWEYRCGRTQDWRCRKRRRASHSVYIAILYNVCVVYCDTCFCKVNQLGPRFSDVGCAMTYRHSSLRFCKRFIFAARAKPEETRIASSFIN